MKLPFKFKNIHHCEAVVLTCIDFRFWRETLAYIESELGLKSFDFPSLPGAAKAVNDCKNDEEITLKCISVPRDLHQAKKLVIVNHQDCGAYGGSQAFNGDSAAEESFHKQELKKAKEKMGAKYSDLSIVLVYAKLVDNGEKIEFVAVN